MHFFIRREEDGTPRLHLSGRGTPVPVREAFLEELFRQHGIRILPGGKAPLSDSLAAEAIEEALAEVDHDMSGAQLTRDRLTFYRHVADRGNRGAQRASA